MKLKHIVLSALGAAALGANVQEAGAQAPVAHNEAYAKSTNANWFLTFQGGASAMFLKQNADESLSKRLSFTPSLSIGKWHSPYYATRLKIVGGEATTFNGAQTKFKHENYFVGGHYDFMFDVVNYFSRYREDRVFHLIPYVGLGYEYKFDSSENFDNVHALTANAGLQLAFHLSKRVDFVLEGEATYNGIKLTRTADNPYYNALRVGVSAGLNFHIGKTGFVPVKPMDEAAVANLQGQINRLRAENAELSKRPVSCPDVTTPLTDASATTARMLAEKSILFKLGQTKVSDDQLITIFDAAEFVKNYDGELVVTGYSQKAETRFAGLAEKRAKAVAKILSERYGVAEEKISVEWKEASEAPFDAKNAWNRVVVIRSK